MSEVFVVGVTELAGPPEAAASALAPELGTTAYELRLTLAAGTPAVVLFTPEEARARAVTAAFQRSGHRAVWCRRTDAVPSARMTPLRDFRLTSEGIVPHSELAETLPYSDVVLLARASHRSSTETTTEVKERKFLPGMAIATGGLILSKTTKREVTTRAEEREQVLYVLPRGGGAGLILRERGARYGGLGAQAARTSLENFGTTLRLLRDACPAAVYDERLLQTRPVRGVPDAVLAADLLAHLLAVDARSR